MSVPPPNKLLTGILAGLALISLMLLCPPKAAAAPGEHQIKAAMIFNFIKFVDWPESALRSGNIDICHVSRGGLSTAVTETLRGKQLKGRNITTRQVNRFGSFAGCHLLLLSDTDRATTSTILDMTRSAPLITVGEARGFTASGGVLGFIILDGRVRFQVNLTAAHQHRLRISSQLLKLAQDVLE